MASHAPITDSLGPNEHTEPLILAQLNAQDGCIIRRLCKSRRRIAGADVDTLILAEEKNELMLHSLDLDVSFPAIKTLILKCHQEHKSAWTERWLNFVCRNSATLGKLQYLDFGFDVDANGCAESRAAPPLSLGVLSSIALFSCLKGLDLTCTDVLPPTAWRVLGNLKQLTTLQLHTVQEADGCLKQVVEACPQLENLAYSSESPIPLDDLQHITKLHSLGLLTVDVADAGNSQVVHSFSCLTGLTHLGIQLDQSVSEEHVDDIIEAVSKLTGLVSLEVLAFDLSGVSLQPLSSLQLLATFCSPNSELQQDQASVLGALKSLKEIYTGLSTPSCAALAGAAAKERCMLWVHDADVGDAVQPRVPLKGFADLCLPDLEFFDVSCVAALVLVHLDSEQDVSQTCQALASCTQLQALQLIGSAVLDARVMHAVAGLKALEYLHLVLQEPGEEALPCHTLALLSRCKALQQLTLSSIRDLGAQALAGLFMMPRLRLLRVLGCSPDFSQEDAQSLIGQLHSYQLRVDVVPPDGSLRAKWKIEKLEKKWKPED